MSRVVRTVAIGALAGACMGAVEGIAVLHGTGLFYEDPVMQALGIEGRYAILGVLLALALRRARPSWDLGVIGAWTGAGVAFAILFFWTHSALLQIRKSGNRVHLTHANQPIRLLFLMWQERRNRVTSCRFRGL